MEEEYKGVIHKFIIIPVCSVYNKENKLLQEEKMRAITHYSVDDIDLKQVASNLEKRANDSYYSKVKASDLRRHNGD